MGISNKLDLARRINEKLEGKYTHEDLVEVIEAALDSVVDIMGEGEKLCIREYFSIKPVIKKGRIVKDNLRGGEEYSTKDRYVPKVNFGRRIMEALEGLMDNED